MTTNHPSVHIFVTNEIQQFNSREVDMTRRNYRGIDPGQCGAPWARRGTTYLEYNESTHPLKGTARDDVGKVYRAAARVNPDVRPMTVADIDSDAVAQEHILWAALAGMSPREVLRSAGLEDDIGFHPPWGYVQYKLAQQHRAMIAGQPIRDSRGDRNSVFEVDGVSWRAVG